MMNKTLLASAISALFVANSAMAVELYKDEVNTFSMGGHVSAGLAGSDEGDTEVESVSPRLNIEAKRDLGNSFVVDAKAEWGMAFMEGGSETFKTRLGYIGLTHDALGRAVVGTQWSPYSTIATVADKPIKFANDFVYENHGNLGTARADKMVSYSKGFALSEDASIDFGLGWQGAKENDKTGVVTKYKDRVQGTLSASFIGFTLGYAYSGGDIEVLNNTEKAQSNLVSAKYGMYGKGLYVAGVYAMNDYMNTAHSGNVAEETTATEAIVAYALDNSLNFSVNYEAVNDEKDNKVIYSQTALQAEYNFLPNVMGYAAYQVDLGNDYNDKTDNQWALGARVFF